MPDLVTLGELLFDLIAEGGGLAEAHRFMAVPGGAPANVAVGASRLGLESAFLGKVGDDPFGRRLAAVLSGEGVDVSGLRFDPSARTALAFVTVSPEGEREFMFYRHPSADMLLRPDEVDLGLVRSSKILHYGSISLIAEPARSATLAAVEEAHRSSVLTSYDPNLRLPLWPSESEARAGILLGWEQAQVIKVSEEELEFLAGRSDAVGARSLFAPALELLVVTRGAHGADWFTPDDSGFVPGFPVRTIDTTGAGDAFVAAMLAEIAEDRRSLKRSDDLHHLLRRANACAAMSTTKRGAIPALPRRHESLALLSDEGE